MDHYFLIVEPAAHWGTFFNHNSGIYLPRWTNHHNSCLTSLSRTQQTHTLTVQLSFTIAFLKPWL